MSTFTLGLDYGTGSVRAILVNTRTGEEIATSVFDYPHGTGGVITSERDPDVARQHPKDYADGAVATVRAVLAEAAQKGITPDQIIGIGVDTTGSTPIPVDGRGVPLAFDPRFENDLSAMAWLWKDHTSHAEAAEITEVAGRMHPEYLAKIGGRYSSEWFWARSATAYPRGFQACLMSRRRWVEFADYDAGGTLVQELSTARTRFAGGFVPRGTRRFSMPRGAGIRTWKFFSRHSIPSIELRAENAFAGILDSLHGGGSGRDALRGMGGEAGIEGRDSGGGGGV